MKALFERRFEAFATDEVLAEYHLALRSRSVQAAIEQVQLHPNAVLDFGQAVTECMQLVSPGPAFRCEDLDDIKFTAASSGARAEYLVTSDGALLALGSVLEATVVTPERFMEVLADHA